MKVFLSWSGSLSHAVAQAFAVWLPTVIQECRDPFVSSDLDKGEAWFQAITDELADSNIGVAFITNDNHSSPWLHFESGAMLTRLQKQRICPVVVDLAKTDYDGPLKNLQLTDLADKNDFYKLVSTINAACDIPLAPSVLRDSFDLRWLTLEAEVAAARNVSEAETPETPKRQRTPDEKIDEILGLVREIRTESPSYRRKSSSEARSEVSDLNWQILERSDGVRNWNPEKVAQYITEHGDVVYDATSQEALGTLVDLKEDSTGKTWVRIRIDGRLFAKPLDGVKIYPF